MSCPPIFWDPLGHNNQQRLGNTLALLVALDDNGGWGWTAGNGNDNGDRDDNMGVGDNNDSGRTEMMTTDYSCPPGPTVTTATTAREARQQR